MWTEPKMAVFNSKCFGFNPTTDASVWWWGVLAVWQYCQKVAVAQSGRCRDVLVAHGKHAHELRLRNDLVDRPGKGCENGGYATMNL